MLLVANINNKFIEFGIFDDEKLIGNFKIKTDINRSIDELSFLIKNLIMERNIKLQDIDDVIGSNVVPELTIFFEKLIKNLFNKKVIFVGTGIKTGLDIKCENPKEVGSDRITMAVAALSSTKSPLLIVNMSHVTTIDMINKDNKFIGGLIFPGIDLCQEVLKKESAKLPNVEIVAQEKIIGNSTRSAMISGLYRSYINACKGIISDIKNSNDLNNDKINIVLTGDFSELLDDVENSNIHRDKFLIFEGLKIIYNLNKNNKNK